MAINVEKAVAGIYETNEEFFSWIEKRMDHWVDSYLGGLKPDDASTFTKKDVDALYKILDEVDEEETILYSGIENLIDEMKETLGREN